MAVYRSILPYFPFSRLREKVAEGRMRVSFREVSKEPHEGTKLKQTPSPALSGTLSRRRERGKVGDSSATSRILTCDNSAHKGEGKLVETQSHETLR